MFNMFESSETLEDVYQETLQTDAEIYQDFYYFIFQQLRLNSQIEGDGDSESGHRESLSSLFNNEINLFCRISEQITGDSVNNSKKNILNKEQQKSKEKNKDEQDSNKDDSFDEQLNDLIEENLQQKIHNYQTNIESLANFTKKFKNQIKMD